MLTVKKATSVFDKLFLSLFVILTAGTPLLFTSLTRSVFEVNKLLLLRVIILLVYGLWLFRTILFTNNNIDLPEDNYYKIGPFRWRKTGLDGTILLWLGVNIACSILAQNRYLAIIGAYDRWEGIITLFNYMMLLVMVTKLVTQRFQLFWILGAMLVSTGLSAVYGVLQSLGYDFMHWSKDPTFRVFACINNPVHYCAYVAMVVPFGIGLLLYLGRHHHYVRMSKPTFFTLFFKTAVACMCLFLSWIYCFDKVLTLNVIQFGLLLGIGWVLCELTPDLIPNRAFSLKWLSFFVLVLVMNQLGWLSFTKVQWAGFLASISVLFVLAPFPHYQTTLKRLVFMGTALIFLTQVLSYSRATFIGFILFMPMFYLLVTHAFDQRSLSKFLTDSILTFFGMGVFCLFYVFKLYTKGPIILIVMAILVPLLILFFRRLWIQQRDPSYPLLKTLFFSAVSILSLVIILFSNALYTIPLLVFLVWVGSWAKGPLASLLERLTPISLFFIFQQVSHNMMNIFTFVSLLVLFYLVALKGSHHLNREQKFWVLGSMLLLLGMMVLPTLPNLMISTKETLISSPSYHGLLMVLGFGLSLTFYFLLVTRSVHVLFRKTVIAALVIGVSFLSILFLSLHQNYQKSTDTDAIKQHTISSTGEHVLGRSSSYGDQHKNNARISMWKSTIPWFKDYPILGSGPDTIKFMYPVYRRSEYGILEGGHNYTPDRLHNEYLNTLVTRGLVGFVVYYVFLIGGAFLLLLRGYYAQRQNPFVFLMIASLTGTGIYLGQVLFNFGVVATLVLFYLIIGLGLALCLHPDFHHKQEVQHEEQEEQ